MTSLPWKAVLWDKDGTLIDSFPPWIETERTLAKALAQEFLADSESREAFPDLILRRLGVEAGKVSSRGVLASGTNDSILGVFFETLSEFGALRSAWKDFRLVAESRLAEILTRRPILPAPMRGAARALKFFHESGFPQGLATSDTEMNARRDLASSGLAQWISFFACSDTCVRPKPDPWSVEAFAEFCRLTPADILVVGDTPADEALARAAGASFLAVLCGTGNPGDFSPTSIALPGPYEIPDFAASFRDS